MTISPDLNTAKSIRVQDCICRKEKKLMEIPVNIPS
jgi:hypothetical protein